MKRILYDLKIIGCVLAILYVVCFAIYLQAYFIPGFSWHVLIVCMLFAVLFIGAIGLYCTKEWARQLLIYANFFQASYFLVLYMNQHSDLASLHFILMSFIIVLFLNQSKIRARLVQGAAWRSILVVDDDEMVLKIVRSILRNNGFSVLTASTGEEGLQIAQQQQPDLIILDVIMPKMKEREVCQKLKEGSETQKIPVIFLTAKNTSDDIQAELEAGAVAHLTKPVNSKELTETVLKVLN